MIVSTSSTCFFSRRPPRGPRPAGGQARSHFLLLVSLFYASVVLWTASRLQVCQAAKVYEGSCSLDSDIVMVEWDAGLRLFFPSSPPPLAKKNKNQRRSTIDDATTTTTTTASMDTALDDDNNGTKDHVVKKKKKKQDHKLEHKARRYLREEDDDDDNGRNSSLLNSRLLSESGSGTTVFPARKCSCSSRYRNVDTSYYCLTLNHENTCRIPAAEDQPIECLKLLSSQSFLRNSWPVAVLWLATMVLYLFTTTGGRFAMRYFCFKISSCFKCCVCFCCHGHRRRDPNVHDATLAEWPNHRIIDQIIAMQERSERLRFRRGMVLGQIGENDSSRSPQDSSVTYILKTTQFNKKSMSSPSEEETLPVTPCTLSPSSSASSNGVSSGVSGNDDNNDEEKDHVAMESGDHDSFSDNDEILCTICLTSIEDGDRVGVLTCDHLFHSECLKAWIKRKNTCPLCQTPNIAKEKEVATNELDGGSSSSSSNSTGENDMDPPRNGGETHQQESPIVQRTSVRSTGVDVSSYRTTSTRTRARTRIATLGGSSVQRNLFRGIRDNNERSVSSPRGSGGGGGSRSSNSSIV
jgi:RING-finger-containing ubiquitin ligase